MSTSLTADEFLTALGTPGWRVEDGYGLARFETGTFSGGVEFLRGVAQIADRLDHHPDVELTYPHVTIRLITHDAGGRLTDLDVRAAREISALASANGHETVTDRPDRR